MSQGYDQNPYAQPGGYERFVIDAPVNERTAFIRRTYAHLFGAILVLIGMEAAILSNEALAEKMLLALGGNWWIVLIAFMAVSWVAGRWATSGASKSVQYAGLGLYTVAEAIILAPLLYMAIRYGRQTGNNYILEAGVITGGLFAILTAVVMFTKADFSFLGKFLSFAAFAALALIFLSMFMGFSLGIFFIGGMVILMCGYILYDTSNIMHHYHTDQHVAAALALFASVATLFWYVLQLVMSRD